MPIYLDFRPKIKEIKENSKEVRDFPLVILNMPSLIHQGANVSAQWDANGNLIELRIIIKGIAVIDTESANMLVSLIQQRLIETDSAFYLSAQQQCDALPGEGIFLHSRFKPTKSRNASDTSCIPEFEPLEKYCCPLSGTIIDHPVYDIRSPEVVYDYDYLMYWLNKSHPKLMPHTRLPYEKAFLKTNYALKSEIIQYVQNEINAFEQKKLGQLLLSFDSQPPEDPASLNKALLRISRLSNDSTQLCEALSLLIRFGVNINCQDEDLAIRNTPLHLALEKGQKNYAYLLLNCGAKINIPNEKKITAFDIIRSFEPQDDRESLIYICKSLKLINVSSRGEISLVGTYSTLPQNLASPITAPGDAHASLVRRLNAILEKNQKRDQLEVFEKSIHERKYGQALRRACNFEDTKRMLPLIEALLESKDKIEIKINEKTGVDELAAVHLAAKIAIKTGDRAIYELLLKHGAKDDLVDKSGKTAAKYFLDSQENKF